MVMEKNMEAFQLDALAAQTRPTLRLMEYVLSAAGDATVIRAPGPVSAAVGNARALMDDPMGTLYLFTPAYFFSPPTLMIEGLQASSSMFIPSSESATMKPAVDVIVGPLLPDGAAYFLASRADGGVKVVAKYIP